MTSVKIENFRIKHYEQALKLWRVTEGVGLSNADSKENLEKYLKKNSKTSFVALLNKQLIGTILAGHDGRRGYIYHFTVDPAQRKKKIGKKLLEKSIKALEKEGIEKCHIMVYKNNTLAKSVWLKLGWIKRREIEIMSHEL